MRARHFCHVIRIFGSYSAHFLNIQRNWFLNVSAGGLKMQPRSKHATGPLPSCPASYQDGGTRRCHKRGEFDELD